MSQLSDIPEDIYERAEILCDYFREVKDDRELVARVIMAVERPLQVEGVTHEQAKALRFIRSFQTEHGGVSPSYDEIGAAIGRGKSNVHDMLHRLADRGVVRLATRARSITIVEKA